MLYNMVLDKLHEMLIEAENAVIESDRVLSSLVITRFKSNAKTLIGNSALSHFDKMELNDRVDEWEVVLVNLR